MESTKRLDVGQTLKGCIEIGLNNVFSVLGAALLWLVTVWIPYLNIGTTIAISTVLPFKLAKGEKFSPTEIFDAKYRENMTNWFLVMGLVYVALGATVILFIFPAIVLYYAWMLAAILVINFGTKPIDALNESYKATYGSKWAIFFTQLILGIILWIVSLIIVWITSKSGFLGFLFSLAFLVVALGLYFGFMAQIIRSLLLDDAVTEPIEQFE